ncbi:hypothetical protein Q9233_005878 [Columba guinea]|nr:hypothetical protein Q9233_005878 [Columba guinea]
MFRKESNNLITMYNPPPLTRQEQQACFSLSGLALALPLIPALLPGFDQLPTLQRRLELPLSSSSSSILSLVNNAYRSRCYADRQRQIDGLEEKLAHCRQSMEEVDVKLRREKLSPEGRKSLERERNLLMTKADNYEKELSALRKENRRNAALAVAMGLLIALIYICWTM